MILLQHISKHPACTDAGVLDELDEEDDLKLSQEDLKILDTILASPPKAAQQTEEQAKVSSRGRGKGTRGRGRGRNAKSKEGKAPKDPKAKKPRYLIRSF